MKALVSPGFTAGVEGLPSQGTSLSPTLPSLSSVQLVQLPNRTKISPTFRT